MEEKIRSILAGILEVEPKGIGDGFGPDSCQNWDSLGNLRIITALEREFAVKFTWEEISSMTNFARIREVIARRGENR
ncbi:MAG: acyl carrier protein [Acidobacteria bacterium]|jgi:acyl carrier protein|nr:acyl carrier protein [Acidobacteriota bacterium]